MAMAAKRCLRFDGHTVKNKSFFSYPLTPRKVDVICVSLLKEKLHFLFSDVFNDWLFQIAVHPKSPNSIHIWITYILQSLRNLPLFKRRSKLSKSFHFWQHGTLTEKVFKNWRSKISKIQPSSHITSNCLKELFHSLVHSRILSFNDFSSK